MQPTSKPKLQRYRNLPEKFVSETFQRRVKLQRDEDFKTIHSTDKKESDIKSLITARNTQIWSFFPQPGVASSFAVLFVTPVGHLLSIAMLRDILWVYLFYHGTFLVLC